MADVKGLGFCVSIAHADYMAQFFNAHGVIDEKTYIQAGEKMKAGGKMSAEERIQEYFNTHWTFEDFIQAYIWAHDIDPRH